MISIVFVPGREAAKTLWPNWEELLKDPKRFLFIVNT
jgi:hypothetical protein